MRLFLKRHMSTITIISAIVYMAWRLLRTIPYEYGTFSTIFGLILFIVEFFGILEMIVHFRQLSHEKLPKPVKVDPKDYPDVDILISTYNEPTELLYKTINGCLNMDYPDKSKVHIYLCDDGHRDEMGVLAKEMGVTHLVRDTHEFAKAGNLNYALSVTHSPYIVTFDADMIPKHDFLTACIPYFLGEEEIGFLQTPQSFYNPDLFQYNLYSESRVPNEQDYFYRDVQVMRNASNTVIFGGTNTILSRKALEDAGGFYTGVITEDFATGMMIESKGYQCYAISDSHACGMAPEDLKSLVKQRQRWARGCIQTGRKVNLFGLKGLSFKQKISYLTSITYWYSPIKRMIYILSPILYAVFDLIVVKCTLGEVLLFWLPMYLLNHYTLNCLSGNIRNTRITNIYETALVPALFLPVLKESFGISQKKFEVTEKDSKEKLKSSDLGYSFKTSITLLVLLVLDGIGWVRCLHFLLTLAIPSYLLILFWLSVNFYYLLMSVFFIYGRRKHREFERFRANIGCLVAYDNKLLRTHTYDISENGISLLFDFPEYIPPEEEITIRLATDRNETEWSGKVANVMQIGSKWKYGISMQEITEPNKRQMMQIVYDRDPTLPRTMENGLSTMDDLALNIEYRKNSKKDFTSKKLPFVELDHTVTMKDGRKLVLTTFDYESLVLWNPSKGTALQKLSFSEEGVVFQCSLQKEISKHEASYRVDNLAELMGSTAFRTLLNTWLTDCRQDRAQERNYRKQIDTTLNRYEVFDELQYLN